MKRFPEAIRRISVLWPNFLKGCVFENIAGFFMKRDQSISFAVRNIAFSIDAKNCW